MVRFSGDRLQAPHICLTLFSTGLLNHATTRLYFDDEPGNLDDPVLCRVPEERRSTLVAERVATGGEITYRFDIVLQGAGETAFLQI